MSARLASGVLVSALLRRVEAAGGNAVVLIKGDPTAGALLITCRERGEFTGFIERVLGDRGAYQWSAVGPVSESPESQAWLARRRLRDPDLWLIELDIAQAKRFAAETSGDG